MTTTLNIGEFTLRLDTRQGSWPDGRVALSRQECAVVQTLWEHGAPMPRDEVIARIWGEASAGSHSRLSTGLRRLKKKLEAAPVVVEYQPTGYVIRPKEEKQAGIALADRHIRIDQSCILHDGKRVTLTVPETKLVATLIEAANRPVSRQDLMDAVWGAGSAGKGPAFSALLHRVRKKLEPDPKTPVYLVQEGSAGLCLRREVASEAVVEEAPIELEAPFVGRVEHTLACCHALTAGVRCLTVLGPGGQGKTRLVRQLMQRDEVASLFPGGTHFCDVADCDTGEAVVRRVAQVLGLQLKPGNSTQEMALRLGHALALRPRSLLVLDNFEQVVSAASATLGTWVRVAHQVQFIVTSRRRLGLAAEQVMPLEALPLTDAMSLFLGRVRQINPSLRLRTSERKRIAPILEAMECNALAVLLSAGQLLETSFEAWADAVEHESYGAGLLETVIQRSWLLLSRSDQQVLMQSTIFRDGFDLNAAEEILHCQANWIEDVLESLLDHSLLFIREDSVGSRFYLYESVRSFCVGREADHDSEVTTRYAAYFEAQARAWYSTIRHSRSPEAVDRARVHIRRDEANLWQVFEQTDSEPKPETGKVAFLLINSGNYVSRVRALHDCFTAVLPQCEQPLRSELQYTHWVVAKENLEPQLAPNLRQASLEDPTLLSIYRVRYQMSLWREEYAREEAWPTFVQRLEEELERWQEPSAERAYLLEGLAGVRSRMDLISEAISRYQEALRVGKGFISVDFSRSLDGNIGHKLVRIGRLDEGALVLTQSLRHMRRPEGRRLNIAVSCWSLGGAYLAQGQIEEALDVFEEGFRMACILGQGRWVRGLNATIGLTQWLLDNVEAAQGSFQRHPPVEKPGNRLIGFPGFARALFELFCGDRAQAEADWQGTAEVFQEQWHLFWAQCVALADNPDEPSVQSQTLAMCSSYGIKIPRTPVEDEDIRAYSSTILWVFPIILERLIQRKTSHSV